MHERGLIVVEGEEAMAYYRVCTMIAALKLELAVPGLRACRFSALAAAKRDFGLTGRKATVLKKLEALRDAMARPVDGSSS